MSVKRKLTIRRINQKTSYLPDECKDRWLTLLRVDKSRKVIDQQVFFVNNEALPTVHNFTHFILHPFYIW